jgi:hypothetical protein
MAPRQDTAAERSSAQPRWMSPRYTTFPASLDAAHTKWCRVSSGGLRPRSRTEGVVERRVGDVVGVVRECLHANPEDDLQDLHLGVPGLEKGNRPGMRRPAARGHDGRCEATERTAGRPKAAFSNTDGKATMRRCCCMYWGSARPLIPYRRRATQPGAPRTNGSAFTDRSISTPGRCSSTSSRMSGSTFAGFRTPSCARKAATISRTAAALGTCSKCGVGDHLRLIKDAAQMILPAKALRIDLVEVLRA